MKHIQLPEESQSIQLSSDLVGYTPVHERKFLCWLARQTAGNILEIGCNRGITTRDLAMTNREKTVFALDYVGPDHGMNSRQLREQPTLETFCSYARDLPNVRPMLLNSVDIDYGSFGKPPVRFIFIDGNHSYEGVRTDTIKALKHIAKVGGCIVWHDYNQRSGSWVKVTEYLNKLDRELDQAWPKCDPLYKLRHVKGTSLTILKIIPPVRKNGQGYDLLLVNGTSLA